MNRSIILSAMLLLPVSAAMLANSRPPAGTRELSHNESSEIRYSNLNRDVLFEILKHVETPNEDLLELAKGNGPLHLQGAARDIMAMRLRKWLTQEDLDSLRLSYADFHRYFTAISSVWKKANPTTRVHAAETMNDITDAKIIAFDSNRQHRIVVFEKTATLGSLSLWNLKTGHQISLKQWPLHLGQHPQAIFIKENPHKIIIQTRRRLELIDIHGNDTKRRSISERTGILDFFVDQQSQQIIYRDWTSKLYAINFARENSVEQELSHPYLLKLIDLGENSDEFVSFSQLAVKVWNKKNLRVKRTIDLSSIDPSIKQIFFNPLKADYLTIIGNKGKIFHLNVNNSTVFANNSLSESCSQSRKRISFNAQTDQLIIACQNGEISFRDYDSLQEVTSVNSIFPEDFVTLLPGKSNWLINWSPGHSMLRILDGKYSRTIAHLGRMCQTSFLSRLCQSLGFMKSEDYKIQNLLVNPWTNDTFLTTNGRNLLIWDVDSQKVTEVLNHYQSEKIGEIYIYPSNPLYIIHIQENGLLTIFDFWEAARNLAESYNPN